MVPELPHKPSLNHRLILGLIIEYSDWFLRRGSLIHSLSYLCRLVELLACGDRANERCVFLELLHHLDAVEEAAN